MTEILSHTKKIMELTPDQFFDYAKAEKMMLIDFWGNGCAPCMFQGELLENEQDKLLKEFPNLLITRMDVYRDEGISDELKIRTIPTIVIVYKLRYGIMESKVQSIENISRFIKEFMEDTDQNGIPYIRNIESVKPNQYLKRKAKEEKVKEKKNKQKKKT